MRTIQAPGVEIKEIDKSQYAPAMAGTAALVMGFANKGEDYNAMQFTSRSSWLNYYGEPDNEAERYFYNACMEVINQNGILYSAKIPYENEARDKYSTKKYTITTRTSKISSVADYMDLSACKNIESLLEGDFSQFGYGLNELPLLADITDPVLKDVLSGYAMTIMNITTYHDLIQRFNKQKNASNVAFPTFFRQTGLEEDDDWVYFNQENVGARLCALFDLASDFWVDFSNRNTGKTVKDFAEILQPLNQLIQAEVKTEKSFGPIYKDDERKDKFNSSVIKTYLTNTFFYSPLDYIKAFVKGYECTFTEAATAYESYNFILARLSSDDLEDDKFSLFLQSAMDPNCQIFDAINKYVFKKEILTTSAEAETELYPSDEYVVSSTTDAYPSTIAPYIYLTEDNCNLPSYYSAAKYVFMTEKVKKTDISDAFKALNNLASPVISGDEDGMIEIDLGTGEFERVEITSINAAPFINLSAQFEGSLLIEDQFIENPDSITQEKLVELIADINNFINIDKSFYNAILDKLVFGKKVNTPYVSDMLAFYGENVNVTGYYDSEALYKEGVTLDVLKSTLELETDINDNPILSSVPIISIDPETGEETVVGQDVFEVLNKTGKNFFDVYGNVVDISETKFANKAVLTLADHMEILRDEFKKTLTKSKMVGYINAIRELEEFKEIEFTLANTSVYRPLNIAFTQSEVESLLKYTEIREVDDTLQDYLTIRSDNQVFLTTREMVDEYKTGESRVAPNTILITDMTRSKYQRATDIKETEFIGLVPVVTTAANAMAAQLLIENLLPGDSYSSYQPLRKLATMPYSFKDNHGNHVHKEWILGGLSSEEHPFSDVIYDEEVSAYTSKSLYAINAETETIGDQAAGYFTTIQTNDQGGVVRDNMYDVGVVVFRAFVDASEGNKVSFQAVESFIGSLDRKAVDPNTGTTKFIDEIVNSQSEYINFFSNCYDSTVSRMQYEKYCDLLIIEPQKAGTLGFYEDMVVEEISIAKSIYDGMEKVFDKNQDINEKDIDIVCDAGLSNIAQYIKKVFGNTKGVYDPTSTEAAMFKLKSRNDTLTWRSVIQKFDNFCKNVRKDCMFIADGLRPLCLVGNKKIVRDTKPANTIDANILPFVKHMAGLNTNYGAGYCDWFLKADDFTGDYFWCPPSIQAMGIYIYTDVNANYFDAPAGLNRGLVAALDVAFSPTNKQAGSIYNQNWNYAINYPKDGIVLEGQKTFQTKPSAFDRVNVRRLFLRLERQTYKVARYFVYEGNTAYTRQRLVDTLDPIFSQCKLAGGIYDYKIICDESINTPNVIDNNELKVKIGIKPTKTAEFILIDFIALSTGGSFDEM